MTFTSSWEKETKEIAKKALEILEKNNLNCLFLKGELGSGKTTFTKGLAENLFIKDQILSPTFVILRQHKINTKDTAFKYLFHFDLYRLKDINEVLELGLLEITKDNSNLVVVEWPELIETTINKYLKVEFKYLGENKREIEITNF